MENPDAVCSLEFKRPERWRSVGGFSGETAFWDNPFGRKDILHSGLGWAANSHKGEKNKKGLFHVIMYFDSITIIPGIDRKSCK